MQRRREPEHTTDRPVALMASSDRRTFDLDRGRWGLRLRHLRAYREWLDDPFAYRKDVRLRRALHARGEPMPTLDVRLKGNLSIPLHDFQELQTFELIFFSGIYTPTPMHRRRLEEACVLDVGAHIGLFAAFAALRGARKVVAIEPVSELADRLRALTRRLAVSDRIHVIEAAASADERTIRLSLQADSLAHSAFLPGPDEITVSSVTLAHALRDAGERATEYLKFNCEGAEFELWESMDPAVLSGSCTALVGWHEMPGLAHRSVLEQLVRSHGFAVKPYANRLVPFLVADKG